MIAVQTPLRRFLLLPGNRHLTENLLNALSAVLVRRHGAMLERLADFADAACLVVPQDLPMAFLITLRAPPLAPRLQLVDPARMDTARVEAPRATIRADIATLFELLEGRIDGDALFFSRDLTVEGDMAVVVALRNAVDDAGIDLIADATSMLGPFAAPAERLGRSMAGFAAQLQRRFSPAGGRMA
ncbi:MAG: SCP2 domain-containing protein [Ferrovibrio sp.]|uniref:ubiquinone anaerobic biosynthesis accessory factor UbiT n=1 Tax=Ferrovibrio sp. TaxID=1917215 RepID=UPI00391D1AFB